MQTKFLCANISKKTFNNYKNLIQICKEHNIKLMAMQYPVRSVKSLKYMLGNFNNITFISNEENFKKELKNHKTKEIFMDMFGGNFGHCTELGNTLIAENVAENILKLYN